MKQPVAERWLERLTAWLDVERIWSPSVRLMLFPALVVGLVFGLLGLLAFYQLRGPATARPSVEEVARLLEYHRHVRPGVYGEDKRAAPIERLPVFADSGQAASGPLAPLPETAGLVRQAAGRAPVVDSGLDGWNELFANRSLPAVTSPRQAGAPGTKPADRARSERAKPAASGPARTARPASANVRVSSDPPGATVWLAGRAYGQTPTTIEGLKPGSYEVRLQKKGYEPYASVVVVRPGRLRGVHGQLKSQKARIGW